MLDCARGENNFEILEYVNDNPKMKEKFQCMLSILARFSDSLKTAMEDFDDEDIEMLKECCEDWGRHWPIHFPHKNITPKGHILSFVIPEFLKHRRTYFMFYKMEQAGESIHAVLNDIERKIWAIKDEEKKMWKYIERYELRNVTNVTIVTPMKRIYKK